MLEYWNASTPGRRPTVGDVKYSQPATKCRLEFCLSEFALCLSDNDITAVTEAMRNQGFGGATLNISSPCCGFADQGAPLCLPYALQRESDRRAGAAGWINGSGLTGWRNQVKTQLLGACMALALSMAAAAHAQGVPDNVAAAQQAAPAAPASSAATQWRAPAAPLTRSEVEREFVQAKRDGELNYLNRTVYAHH